MFHVNETKEWSCALPHRAIAQSDDEDQVANIGVELRGFSMSTPTVTMDKINPKKVPGLETLGDSRFLQFFRVVSRDWVGKPRTSGFLGGFVSVADMMMSFD